MGLECSVLSVSTGPWRGSAGEVFFVVCGQPSLGVQNAVRRNHVSVVPSGNLVCHSPDLLLLISR